MATRARCPDGDCPTIGVEAAVLERYGDVATEDGQWLIYDVDEEAGWIQSDLYLSRESCV